VIPSAERAKDLKKRPAVIEAAAHRYPDRDSLRPFHTVHADSAGGVGVLRLGRGQGLHRRRRARGRRRVAEEVRQLRATSVNPVADVEHVLVNRGYRCADVRPDPGLTRPPRCSAARRRVWPRQTIVARACGPSQRTFAIAAIATKRVRRTSYPGHGCKRTTTIIFVKRRTLLTIRVAGRRSCERWPAFGSLIARPPENMACRSHQRRSEVLQTATVLFRCQASTESC
jgi:hypothetical protein